MVYGQPEWSEANKHYSPGRCIRLSIIIMELLIGIGVAVLGAILASFVSVVVERVHTGASWVGDRSRCDACATTLTARDLLPVVSWLIARGVCRTCGSRIPVRLLVVEVSTALVFLASYLLYGLSYSLFLLLGVLLLLLFIVLYDLRHTIVPMVPACAFVIGSLLFRFSLMPDPLGIGLALLVAGLMGGVFLLFFVCSRGRAMGLGDAPIVLGLALLVGPLAALPGVLFSFWIGALYGIVVLVSTPRGHRMGIEVPFVPFLALGFLLAFFTGWNPLLF